MYPYNCLDVPPQLSETAIGGLQKQDKINTDATMGQTRLFLMRLIRSFSMCSSSLQKTFCQAVVARALFVVWRHKVCFVEGNRLNKLGKKASSVVGLGLECLEMVAERRIRKKI